MSEGVVPVTVRQARQFVGCMSQLVLVARVQGVTQTAAHTMLRLDDGTASVTGILWARPGEHFGPVPPERFGRFYVRVVGRVRAAAGDVFLDLDHACEVSDANWITCHLMEIVAFHLHARKLNSAG